VRRSRAVVLAGGDHVAIEDVVLPEGAFVVAADSGLHLAAALGLPVDVVVGDLDSVEPDALAMAEAAGARVDRHPSAKDETDLELALRLVLAEGCERVLVLGLAGGRLDHFLANLLLLASLDFAPLKIEAVTRDARVHVVHHEVTLRGDVGDVVTLLPVGGIASGIRTTGLVYPLNGETLHPGSTRGVSNVLAAPVAHVALAAGVLLAIQPREESR
jgi:thiamine pyrophosphokinase